MIDTYQAYKSEPIRDRDGSLLGWTVIHRATRRRVIDNPMEDSAACRMCQRLNHMVGARAAGLC